MASTITSLRDPERITVAVGDQLVRVDLPAKARKFTVQALTNPGKLAWAGTDAAAIGAKYVTIQADSLIEVDVRDGDRTDPDGSSVYLTSATAGTVIEIIAEE